MNVTEQLKFNGSTGEVKNYAPPVELLCLIHGHFLVTAIKMDWSTDQWWASTTETEDSGSISILG